MAYEKVILQLPFDNGTSVASSVIDYSPSPRTVSLLGGASLSSTNAYGGGGVYLPSAGACSRVSVPVTSAEVLIGGDFTIQLRWLPTHYDSWSCLFSFSDGSLEARALGTTIILGSSFTTVNTLGTWNDFELSVVSNVGYIFVNGTSIGTISSFSSAFSNPASGFLTFGGRASDWNLRGYIDAIRVHKGEGLHTANFTPIPFGFPTLVSLSAPSPLAKAFGGGQMALSSPAGIVTSDWRLFEQHSDVSASAPMGALSAMGGGNAYAKAPSPALYATGHDSTGEQAANLSAPRPQLVAQGGGNTKLTAPRPQLDASATVTRLAGIDLSAPRPVMSATGRASETGSANLIAPMASVKVYGGGLVSVTGPMGTVQATGTTGSIGGASVSCPLFELTADGHTENYGSANLIAPSPKLGATIQAYLIAPIGKLTAVGSAVVTVTYEAYAVNLNHAADAPSAVTRYTNFPFTHVVRYQNSYYGANSTGLYLLEGTTDEATPIPWSFKTGITDFDDAKQKTVAAAYFGGSMPPATTVTLFEGDKVGVPYAQTTPRGASLQNYRETFARGVKGRYYALGLSGTGDIELDDLDFEIKQLTRRI